MNKLQRSRAFIIKFRSPGFARGFSLLEILVALAVVSTALIPISSMVSTSKRRNLGIEYRNKALSILDARLQTLRDSSFKTLEEYFFPELNRPLAGNGMNGNGMNGNGMNGNGMNGNGMNSKGLSGSGLSGRTIDTDKSIKKTFDSKNIPPEMKKRIFFNLDNVKYLRIHFNLFLEAEIYKPVYSFKAYSGKSYVGPSQVRGTRKMINFRLRVLWKESEAGKVREVEACYIKTPAA
jgi:prepilin-type N-terminal cleavage/methylation domain-containing protein